MFYGCLNLLIKHSASQTTRHNKIGVEDDFAARPGEPVMPFPAWIHMFKNHILAANQ